MLDKGILDQVRGIFAMLDDSYTFQINYSPERHDAQVLIEFLKEVASCSNKLDCRLNQVGGDALEFALFKNNIDTGVKFRGIPNGHEFTSLLLAVLNADGKGKNLPDEAIAQRIKSLKGEIKLQTYVSLTCTNCPDIVQALNVIALQNHHITHEMIDGALFQDEVNALNIQSVPTVYANGELFHVGRGGLSVLLQKLEDTFGSEPSDLCLTERIYDLLVVGGGPAGASAAIYSARKGLNVAIIAERVGGQVKETVGIENLISVPYTTGEQLAADIRTHIGKYPIDVFEHRKVADVQLQGEEKRIKTIGNEVFVAPAVIVATGASWRKLNVEGEADYIGRGVAFCPHCDGPFYAGKDVAVIGGGNSGIEAAIDLAGICRKVTVFEFADSLKADRVLQQNVRRLVNVEILTSMQTTRVIGDGKKMTGLKVKNRETGEEREYSFDGVFVQIGLVANSEPFASQLETSSIGEIKIDAQCRTSIPGVYAAGDVSTVPYKQIIISMGEGAKAALSAFDDRIHGVVD